MIKKLKQISVICATIMIFALMPSLPVQAATPTMKIGDYVQMGKYNDDAIMWRCIYIDGNGPLMISDKILTIKPFDAAGKHKYLDGTVQADVKSSTGKGYRTAYGSNLWETSNMRSWLNSTATAGNVNWLDQCPPTADKVWGGYNAYANEKGFLADGNFTTSERNAIKSVTQKSLLNSADVTKLSMGGTATHIFNSFFVNTTLQNYDLAYYHNVTDKMFLVDAKQMAYLYNNAVLGKNYLWGKPTQKAVDNSTYKDAELSVDKYWHTWSRSPGADSSYPYFVRYIDSDGYVLYFDANYTGMGVRPAFYLDLSTVIVKSGTGAVGTPYVVDETASSITTP